MVKKRNAVAILMVMAMFVFWMCAGDGVASTAGVDKVLVVKSQHRLMLLKDGEILRSYEIALGKEPLGAKMCKGDKKTPEGSYVLDRRNPFSRFHRAIHISYPNRADLDRAQGQGVPPGGDIMIHGLPRGKERVGELHTMIDWTDGCIAVTNEQIDEIWRLVADGTPIEIRP
ncbi:MAG TPA: L,D-transpeptidase family protein [Geobacteraceae bacterium]